MRTPRTDLEKAAYRQGLSERLDAQAREASLDGCFDLAYRKAQRAQIMLLISIAHLLENGQSVDGLYERHWNQRKFWADLNIRCAKRGFAPKHQPFDAKMLLAQAKILALRAS